MIRDETVFVIGEEVARYNGAYKVSLASLPSVSRRSRNQREGSRFHRPRPRLATELITVSWPFAVVLRVDRSPRVSRRSSGRTGSST